VPLIPCELIGLLVAVEGEQVRRTRQSCDRTGTAKVKGQIASTSDALCPLFT